MALNQRRMHVSPEAVWRVLADPRTYSSWVVGTTAIRDADDAWPEVGACLYYSVGLGPVRHDGHTEVLDVTPGRRLELEAHAWPAGTARIELLLMPDGDGCAVTMVEAPARGPAGLLHNPVGDLLIKLRNVEALRRLERLAWETGAQP